MHDGSIQRLTVPPGQLALTGITFVASSGDGGVGFSQAEECLVNFGTLEAFAGAPSSFVGQFPASCPYVTAVGATQVGSGNSVSARTNKPVLHFAQGKLMETNCIVDAYIAR